MAPIRLLTLAFCLVPSLSYACTVTARDFDRIEKTMTFEQVERIMGCEGRSLIGPSALGLVASTWEWKDGGAQIRVTFDHGRVVAKTKSGLK